MLESLKIAACAAALALTATPAFAQDEPEEPRTTYAVTMLKFADGADEQRWLEVMDTYVNPAREASGAAAETIHWVMMSPDYDIITVADMPGGMGNFDSHAPAGRMAFVEALTEMVGGEAQLEALREEMEGMIEKSTTLYTHTHP
ncbi:hypothetical protein [Aurantiacibacter zhengii]|uniref:Group 1 truncated hemoglobin n=1 Tax=Aurantiacibacter zhengii TaxID=2307003 RepID=A0A418NP16_9SPHN|nr:hypothetical protein [Aurantiacibacter zhengii]RIV83388.1 hypothetical protein D2V07_16710 [Aurantiacibacter zhengii]